MVALGKISVGMTVDEFFAWNPDDPQLYELVDGEPRAMAPTMAVHGLLQGRLAQLIRNHLQHTGSEAELFIKPGVIPAMLAERNTRIPDIGVTASALRPGERTIADPILLVEILSPSNLAHTWSNVWSYTSIPTMRDILVLHTERMAVELLRRAPDGAWPDETEKLMGGDIVLSSIEFRVALSALYARTGLPGAPAGHQ